MAFSHRSIALDMREEVDSSSVLDGSFGSDSAASSLSAGEGKGFFEFDAVELDDLFWSVGALIFGGTYFEQVN